MTRRDQSFAAAVLPPSRGRSRALRAGRSERGLRLVLPWLAALAITAHAQRAAAGPPSTPAAAPSAAAPTLRSSDLEAARRRYAQAFSEESTFDRAGNLGAVELALGDDDAAVVHLTFAVEHYPDDASPELRTAIEQRLAEARGRGGTLAAARQRFRATAPPAEDERDSPTGPNPVVLGVGVGITLVGVAAGAALAAVSAAHDDVAFAKGSALEDLALPDPCGSHPAVCDEIRAEQDARDALGAASGVAFGVGGAALVGTLLYALLAGDGDPAAASEALAWRPALGIGRAAINLRCSF